MLAVLLGLGVPAMGTYLQNSKLASAAASYYSGLQMARTEAIRRNVRTEFVLTDTPVYHGEPRPTWRAPPSAAGTGSSGRRRVPGSSRSKRRPAREGDGNAGAAAIQVAGSASAPAVFDGRVPFNGFGGTADGAPYSIDITNPAAGTCVQGGGKIRCRRITVSPGGQIAACDPAA